MVSGGTFVTPARAQILWNGAPELDLRYEVAHPPTKPMWTAMMNARPGMASVGEDLTVRALEQRAADLTGQERAFFLPTTTSGTVAAFLAADVAGSLTVLEARSHIYWMEQLHVSRLSGTAPRPILGDRFGAVDLAAVDAILTESVYGLRQRVGFVCLENSHNVCGGTTLTPQYTADMAAMAHRHGARLFLDGARVFNSAVSLNTSVSALTGSADVVVVSLNKGLGAPLGALLCSDGSFIERARDVARQTGAAAVHKAGIFAAAALVALDGMTEQLADDHRRARVLARELSQLDGLAVDLETVQTNLVRVTTHGLNVSALEFARRVAEHGLAIHVLEPHAFKVALCYAIDDEMLERAVAIFRLVVDELSRTG